VRHVLIGILCGVLFLASHLANTSASPQRSPTPNPHGDISIPCENCHSAEGWSPIRKVPEFDHDRTEYPLRGGHKKVKCTRCHASPTFTDVRKNCADCHADIHLRKFGPDCAQCHVVQGWFTTRQQILNHQNLFPLIGAHAAVECEACHKAVVGGQYRVLPYCSACHSSDFKKTTNPSHVALNFPETCDSCHSQDSWLGAKFPHQQFTGFALTGAHASLNCQNCHASGNYKSTTSNCFTCHAKDFQKAQAPRHIAAGYSTVCATCHVTATWMGATSPQAHVPLLNPRNAGGH